MSKLPPRSNVQRNNALKRLLYDRQGKHQAMANIRHAWEEWRAGRGPSAQGTLRSFLERMLAEHPQIRNAGSIKNAIKRWRTELSAAFLQTPVLGLLTAIAV